MMEFLFTYIFAFLILAVFFALYHLYDYENDLTILGNRGICNIDANRKKKPKSILVQELAEKGATEEEISQFEYHKRGEMIFAIVAIACAAVAVGLWMTVAIGVV